MVESFIRTLAAALEQHAATHERSDEALAQLAHEQLARAAEAVELDVGAVLRFACASQPRRGQHAAAETLPLWTGERFDILAHLWLDTIAPPHDHGWAGAFHIFAGRSLNTHHRFEGELDPRGATIGQLRRERWTVHGPGETIRVSPGPSFIHAVQYLDRPGLAISVRSKQRQHHSTTYFRPGLALGQHAIDDELRGRLHALTTARTIDEQLWLDGLTGLLDEGDLAASFLALSDLVQAGLDVPEPARVVGEARHGAAFATLMAALDDIRAYQEIVELRVEHHDVRLRSVLAALYACEQRDELPAALAVVGALEPGADPWACIGAALVALWVDDDEGELELPPQLPLAFARLAAGATHEQLRTALLPSSTSEPVLELLASAREAIAASPLHRVLSAGL